MLGLVLFTQYTVPIGALCRQQCVAHQLFSDDTKLYVTFKVYNVTAQGTAHLKIEACITDIRTWMALHRLKLNDDKTEYLLILSSANFSKITVQTIEIGDSEIASTSAARTTGVVFDDRMD